MIDIIFVLMTERETAHERSKSDQQLTLFTFSKEGLVYLYLGRPTWQDQPLFLQTVLDCKKYIFLLIFLMINYTSVVQNENHDFWN